MKVAAASKASRDRLGHRLSTLSQARNPECGDFDYGCTRWRTDGETSGFVGDVESSTILIQQAVAPMSMEAIGGK